MAGKEGLKTPYSMGDESVLVVLQKNGYIQSVKKGGRGYKQYLDIELMHSTADKTPIKGFRFVSRPSKRVYRKYEQMRPVRQGYGIAVISTSQGIMTQQEAKGKKIGGQVLFEIW